MVINGQAVKGANRLAHHLTKSENEVVEILEISGVSNDNLRDAFRDMEAVGVMTNSQTGRVLYHANIDPRKNEKLTDKEYLIASDLLMERLGFEGQPRAVVKHVKEGRQHAHLVVQLTDVEKGKLRSTSNNFYKHKEVSRELEMMFELEKTSERKLGNSYSQKEAQQAKKLGMSASEYRALLRGRFLMSKSGKEFRDRLALEGFTLAQGKRVVVLDRLGNPLSLSRQLGRIANAKKVREKLKDIEQELPSIEDAQLIIRRSNSRENLKGSQEKMMSQKRAFKKGQELDGKQAQFDKRLSHYKTQFKPEKTDRKLAQSAKKFEQQWTTFKEQKKLNEKQDEYTRRLDYYKRLHELDRKYRNKDKDRER